MKRFLAGTVAALSLTLGLAACSSDADIASDNLSRAADNFEIARRIVFINGITDKYILAIEGYCSLGNNDKTREISVTCKDKDGYGGFKKYFVGLADNITYTVEQLAPALVSTERSRVVFKPEQIIPGVRVGG